MKESSYPLIYAGARELILNSFWRMQLLWFDCFNITVMSPTETFGSTNPTDHSENGNDKWTVYNSEIGSFGDNGELEDILTSFDRVVHNGEMSTHKGEQILEKMITGKYLAELFR